MLRTRIFFVALFGSMVATVACAQDVSGPVTFSPGSPTELDQIRATFTKSGACAFNDSTIVARSVVRTTVSISSCILGPPPVLTPESVVFGPLPPNTYTYEIYVSYESSAPVLAAQTQIVVAPAPAPVPTLSPLLLAALGLSLAIAAFVALQRAG